MIIELVQDRLLPDCKRSESAPQRWWWVRIVFFWGGLLQLGVSCGWGQWTEPVPMEPQYGRGLRSPWISNDNLRLYLCAIDAIYVVTRASADAPWGPLTRLPDHINLTNTQVSACESPSGDTLYFMSDERPEGTYGSYDIFYSVRTDTGWGPAINCGPNVNGPGREWSVGISRDGGTLLISSGGPLGLYLDLYYCEKQTDGTWGPAIDFGPAINSSFDDESPSLSPDGSRLYYYQLGPNSGDIWESRKINGAWQEAATLPPPINDPFRRQMSSCIAADGRTLWYRAEQHVDSFDYQIVTSIDTTVLSVSEQSVDAQSAQGMVLNAQSGVLIIRITGFFNLRQANVTIYDVLGRQTFNSVVSFVNRQSAFEGSISISDLPAGTYFAKTALSNISFDAKFTILP